MIKVLFLLLFISCQQSWTVSEKSDFINRCKINKLENIDNDIYEEFCICLLKNSINLNISYNDFLKKKIDSDEIDTIVQSCID